MSIYGTQISDKSSNAEISPFEITISDVKIVSDSNKEDNPKLSLTISIENITEQEFNNVWFEIMLNDEIEPYIASHILTYESGKMDVTTKMKSQQDINDLNICGFWHKWTMLLTSEDDLEEQYNLTQDSLYSALKEITVNVYWENGQQSNSIPISLMK